jgi:hypothetical protein
VLLAGAAAVALAHRGADGAERRAVTGGVAILVVLQTCTVLGPIPPSPTAMVLAVLTTFVVVAAAAARTERRLTRVPSPKVVP